MDNSRSSPHSSGNGVLGDVTNLSVGEIRRNRERERYAALSDEQKKARLAKNRQYKQQHKHQPTTSLPGTLDNITNLSAIELRRKHGRERYASLTVEQKENWLQKMRERYQRNKSSVSSSENINHPPPITPRRLPFTDNTGCQPTRPVVTPRRLPFTSDVFDSFSCEPTGIIDPTTQDNIMGIAVSSEYTGIETMQPAVTPRRLPFILFFCGERVRFH
uniref:Uncharacterized protein n=1 Tax=Leersia perrieri TaxID=77586 RepID=A0A0D9WEV2_9ORYZ